MSFYLYLRFYLKLVGNLNFEKLISVAVMLFGYGIVVIDEYLTKKPDNRRQ